jgi:fibronectin-binding autotransporter adhesin
MKTTMTPTSSPAWSLIEILQLMKTKLTILKYLIILCCAFATTTVFGQAIIVWNGGDGTGTAIGAATNWVGGVSPNSGAGDICQWDGTVPGNLFLTASSPNGNFNNGTPGVSFYIAAGHTGSWNLRSLSGASANIALNATTIDSGAGAYSLGDGSANVLNIILRPSSSGAPFPIHTNLNNSANAATINPNVRYQSGGGNPHTVQFDGTGDWIVNNALNCANAGNNNVFLVKMGSGTMFWNPNSIAAAAGVNGIGSPMDIEGGRVVLTATAAELGTQRVTNNNGIFQYAVNAPLTWSGPFDGTNCTIVVSAGTLTLSSTLSDFDGTIILTNGGILNVGGNQNVGGTGPLGTNGPISFKGGTLQFSVANTFDYSPRFDTSAGQAYSIDTLNLNVTLTNALTSSGGTFTKLGSSMLTLSGANTYSGLTTISAGKLEIQGSQGSGSITVGNSTILGVTELGPQITPATLTVGTSAGATLEFNNVSSESTPPIAAGTVTAPAGSPITVNVVSGSFLIGHHYPLLSFTGTPPGVTLGTLVGAVGNLSTNGNTIQLNVTGLAFVWDGLNNANWDTTTPNNWKVNGVAQTWADGSAALFDDTITTANTNVTLSSAVSPASTTVNSVKPYSITSSGTFIIGGSGGLTKNGNSTLTLAGGVNNYTGVTTINAGTVSVGALANGLSPSDIGASANSAANLVLNGGTLLYTGGAQDSDRRFTLGTAGGTIDSSGSGALALTNSGAVALSGTGARTLTLRGIDLNDNILAASLGDNGGATALTKADAGKWIVTGNNTNSGTVTISAGTLQVGIGGASGSVGSGNIVDNGTLDFNTTSTLTNGTVTGTGAVTVDGGGTIVLPGNNNYSGATTINLGTLQIGNGGASGALNNGASIVDNDTLIYNSTSTVNVNGLFGAGITGSGNVIVRAGTFQAIGNNSYTGWTEIDPGATFQACSGPVGALASSVVTNNGTLLLIKQDTFTYSGNIVGSGAVYKECNNGNNGNVTLLGNNTYTGGTYIIGGSITFGDNSTPGAGAFVGNVFLTNDYPHNQFGTPPNDFVPATLVFNRPDDFTFPGNIVGSGFLVQQGSGVLTLTGNNTYTNNGTPANTTISAGTLQVGNGGTTGSIGFGPVADNSVLAFNRSDAVTIADAISGGGSLEQRGFGKLILTANNTYTGTTTVSNGVLIINGANSALSTYVAGGTLGGTGTLSGPVTLDPGTKFAPGSTDGTLTINSDLSIGGNMVFEVNKSWTPLSNDFVVVTGVLTNTGTGTLRVANLGPALAVGDTFTLFSQAVSNGAAMTVTGAGATWQNNLAVDGSITALTVPATVNTNAPVMHVSVFGNTLSLAWPTNLGWTLQTNSVGLSAANQWFPYAGSSTITNVSITINPAKANVFFRMVYTNTP